jgi:two-component system cell cycle sensor histidine kinase/response regulator CckA
MDSLKGRRMSSTAMRFEKLLEAVPDSLVGMDQKGVIRFVNRQTEMLFGYERDQLIGEPIDALVPETLWQIYAQHQQEYFADPRTRSSGLDVELSGRHHDGGEFPINVSMSHIDTGDVLLVITAVADVTRREDAVRNAGLVEAIVENSDDAIISSTLQGTITSWNPTAERMYGYTSEEIVGRPASLLTPEDRADETRDALAKIGAGQHVEHLETTRLRKDGTPVPVSVTMASIRGEDGVVVGVSETARDVTEQRKAFVAAQRMAAIVENCQDAIVGRDLDGVITSWNPAAEVMYGYTSEEIVGRRIDLFVPEDQVGETDTILDRIKAGKHVASLETQRVRKDGTVVPVSLTVSPIRDARGELVGTSVIHRDRI